MRRLAVLAALLWAPAAHAQPQALGRAEAVALSGGAAIVVHASSRTVTVTRVPFDGGARTVILTAPVQPDREAGVEVAASPQRIGVTVTISARTTGAIKSSQLYTGPSAGPLTAVPGNAGAFGMAAGGDSILIDSERGWTAVGPDGTRTKVDVPGDATSVEFAGDLVAYGADPPTEEDPPTRLVVANWRTGAIVRSVMLPAGLIHLDLREDGRAVIETDGGPLRELSAGGTLRDLPHDGGQPVQAGDRIVITRRDAGGVQRLVVLNPDGTQQRVGLPSQQIPAFTADADRVLWRSNGCSFVAGLDDPFAMTFANAGCRASEVDVPYAPPPGLARRVPIPIRCLNTATGVCTGSVRGREILPVAYSVPAGRRRVVRVRVRARSLRRLRGRRYRVLHLSSPPGFPFLLRDR